MKSLAGIVLASVGMTSDALPVKIVCLAVCIVLIVTELKPKRYE